MNEDIDTGKDGLQRAFDRKRADLLDDYALATRPSLILQASLSGPAYIDLSNTQLQDAFRKGGGAKAGDGWWNGFQFSWWPRLVFDGLSSKNDHDAGWATELHDDGHLAAVVWKFPGSNEGSAEAGLAIADFYVCTFRDFCHLAEQVAVALGLSGPVQLTATLHKAHQLPLVDTRGRIAVAAPLRSTFSWPRVSVDAAGLSAAGLIMAGRLMRIYGRKVTQF